MLWKKVLDKDFDPMKQYLYEKGLSLVDLTLVMGLELRNLVMARKGIPVRTEEERKREEKERVGRVMEVHDGDGSGENGGGQKGTEDAPEGGGSGENGGGQKGTEDAPDGGGSGETVG